jgi:hypothetical protein
MYPSVVEKVVLDQALAVLILPVWPSRWFYQAAKRIEVKAKDVEFPAGTIFFELDGVQQPPIRWAVEAVLACGDPELVGEAGRERLKVLTEEILEHRRKIMEVKTEPEVPKPPPPSKSKARRIRRSALKAALKTGSH